MNTQDTNNILSLSSCSQRFSLLPIASNLSSGSMTSSKGNLLKSNLTNEHGQNHVHLTDDSNTIPLRPFTTNLAENATFYSKWFQNIVKQ